MRRYVGYTQHNVSLAVHRGLPSRSVTLIISLADPVRVVDGPHLLAAVGGLHLGPVLISQDRFQRGLSLDLSPLGLRALLGVPSTELTAAVVDLADLPVPWARRLPDRLADAPDWPSRFDVLDAELTAAVKPVRLVEEIQWAWRRMVTGHGGRPVTELAGEVGWSRRHFTERFAGEVGMGPKQISRLIRFERSGELLRAGGALAEVAITAGYYDQAHMSNEWRVLAGCSPSEWIREELPFLQDVSVPDEPESSA